MEIKSDDGENRTRGVHSQKYFSGKGSFDHDYSSKEDLFPRGNDNDILKIVSRESKEIRPEEIASPIDGGWGWMVVLGSFFSNFIVDGIVFSYGLKTEAILESFKEAGQNSVSITDIGWIISLLHGFYGIGGPLAAAMSNRFGFRVVAIIGSILASFGFGIAYLFCRTIPNLYALLILNGVIGGIGTSLMYVPSIIAVGFYFEKHRGIATGICVCGAGVGQTVFGTLVYYFLVYLGWKLTLVVESGLFLSVCFFSVFYRPLQPQPVMKVVSATKKLNAKDVVPLEKNLIGRLFSGESLGSFNRSPSKNDQDVLTNKDLIREDSGGTNSTKATDSGRRIEKRTQIGHSLLQINEISGVRELHSSSDINTINSPLFRDDILYRGDMNRIPEYAKTVGSGILGSKEWCVLVTDDRVEDSKVGKDKHERNYMKSLKKLFGVEILTSYSFILVAASAVVTALALIIPYAYLQGIAIQNNQQSSDTTIFFTVMGASSTVSRIICGIIADTPKVKPAILLAVALTVGGVATSLLPLCTNYWLFIAFSIAFGFMAAFSALLLSLIIVDLMSLENLTNAFGYLCIFTGIASIVGAPIAGFLQEHTGSYNTSFFAAGGLLILSGMALFPTGCVNHWERGRNQHQQGLKHYSSVEEHKL